MFCKFCGKAVPDSASFCTSCGKPLNRTDVPVQQTGRAACLPFVLVLLLLCAPTVYRWRGTGLATVTLIETASLVVGLLLMGLLIWRKAIRTDVYSYADLPLMICVCVVFPLLLSVLELQFAQAYYGEYGVIAWVLSSQAIRPVIRLYSLWLVLDVIVLGVERTGRWQMKNWQRVLLYLAPLIWTPIGFWLIYGRGMSSTGEITGMIRQILWMTSLFGWLEPMMLLLAFWRLGTGRVGRIGATAALLVALAGECCLMFLLAAVMHFAIGIAIGTVGLGALLGWPILFLATRIHTGRAKKNPQPV